MSSVKASEVFRSLSFRRWLPPALILAMLPAAALWWLTAPIQEMTWDRWKEKVGEELDELIIDSWEIGTLGPMLAVEVEIDAFEDHDAFEEFDDEEMSPRQIQRILNLYTSEVRERLMEPELESDERLGLRLRLALLGQENARILADRPVHAYLEHLFDELPDPVHDTIIERAERFFEDEDFEEEDFEEDEPSLSELSAATLTRILEQEEWIEERPETCLEVREGDYDVAFANLYTTGEIEEAGDGFFFWPVAFSREDSDDPRSGNRHCLATDVPLADGSVRFGHDVTETRRTLRQIALAPYVLATSGVMLAILISFLVARSRVRYLETIRDVRRRLAEGDPRARLETSVLGGDLGRAAAEINAILDQLEQSVDSLSHVADNIAHDLRTPLTRMQGQLDMLKRSPQANESMVAAVQDEADQLLATFNALLRIAQIESGNRRRGFRRFDLARVVTDVGELYEPAFADKDLEFQVRLPRRSVSMHGDSDLWMQALSNLLDNALKYTPSGGEVSLRLMASGGAARLEVRDSGPGIPEGERENVFRRFYRLPRQQERGSGLGLSLVGAVCDLHGATITLGHDNGLVVTVNVPRLHES